MSLIYFARLDDGNIKIGFSTRVHARLTGSAARLNGKTGREKPTLLAVIGQEQPRIPGLDFRACSHPARLAGLRMERDIHERFAHLRVDVASGSREVFAPGADLMMFILEARYAHQVPPRGGGRKHATANAGVPIATIAEIAAMLIASRQVEAA